jgi:hypothetical protein
MHVGARRLEQQLGQDREMVEPMKPRRSSRQSRNRRESQSIPFDREPL